MVGLKLDSVILEVFSDLHNAMIPAVIPGQWLGLLLSPVLKYPGRMRLTLTPQGCSSLRNVSMSKLSAAFDAP